MKPKPAPQPIIPPDPPPPPPRKEVPSTPPKEEGDDRSRESRRPRPTHGDRREIPRRPTPPAIIGRHDAYIYDSRSTPSVGSGGPAGFDLIHIR